MLIAPLAGIGLNGVGIYLTTMLTRMDVSEYDITYFTPQKNDGGGGFRAPRN